MTTTVPNATMEDAIADWVAGASGLTVWWEGQDGPRPAAPYIALLLHVEPTGPDWSDKVDNPLTFADKAITSFDATTNAALVPAHGLATGDGPVELEVTGGVLPAPLEVDTSLWWIRDDDDHGRFATSLYRANAGTAIDLQDAGTGAAVVIATDDTRAAGAEILHRVHGLRRCRLVMTCFATSATGATNATGTLSTVAAKARLPGNRAALRAAGVGIPTFGAALTLGGVLNSVHFEPRAVLEAVFFAAQEITETGTYVEFVGIGLQVDDLTEIPVFAPADPAA